MSFNSSVCYSYSTAVVLLSHAFASRKVIVFAAQEHIPGLTFHCEKSEFMSRRIRNTYDSTITIDNFYKYSIMTPIKPRTDEQVFNDKF
jgi:hypothetical protein